MSDFFAQSAIGQTLDAVQSAYNAGDLARALQVSENAMARGMRHPMFLQIRGFWLARNNRADEAVASFRGAVEISPDDPVLRESLGTALISINRWPEAAEQFRAVALAKRGDPRAQFNLGWALENAGRLDEARDAYQAALAVVPRFAPALSALSALAARRADWPEAESLAARALAIDPRQHMASITRIRAATGEGRDADAERFIADLLKDGALSPNDRSLAQSLKADLLHRQKHYPEAFAAYTQAKAGLRDSHAAMFARTTGPAQYADAMLRSLHNYPLPPSVAPHQSRMPVFLGGFPRSGTTLLEQALAGHRAIATLQEANFLAEDAREFQSDAAGFKQLAQLTSEAREQRRAAYWDRVRASGTPADKIIVDKDPYLSLKLPVISQLFPHAKVLFTLRDPRDAVLGAFRAMFVMSPANYELTTLEGTARLYDAMMRLAEWARGDARLQWYALRQENLVENFEPELRKICDFLEVPWDPAMLAVADRGKSGTVATPSAVQLASGLGRDGVGQWRNYRDALAPVLPILQPWVEKFGYSAD